MSDPLSFSVREGQLINNVATLSQRLLFVFLEHTFATNITQVSRYRDDIFARTVPTAAGQYFVEFPHHLFTAEEEEEKQLMKASVLCASKCQDAIALLGSFVSFLLSHHNMQTCELDVALGHFPSTVSRGSSLQYADKNSENTLHTILGVRSTNTDLTYIIDLSGPQYGIPWPSLRWDQYCKLLDAEIRWQKNPGAVFELYSALEDVGGGVAATMELQNSLMTYFCAGIREWEMIGGLEVREMLEMSEEEFDENCEELVKWVSGWIAEFVRGLGSDEAEVDEAKRWDDPEVSDKVATKVENEVEEKYAVEIDFV